MKTKVLKTIALAAAMLAQVGGAKAQSYTTEVYDFKTWCSESGSYATEINTATSTSVTVTSTETNYPTVGYVETAQFYGHDLNGRFAHTSTDLTADQGLKSGYNSKRRYLSILNLQRGDVVIIEGGNANVNVTSKNAICISDEDGTSTVLTTATAINYGAEYVFNADAGTFDIGLGSSNNFTITKVTIKKLNTALSTTDENFDFQSWYVADGFTTSNADGDKVKNTHNKDVYIQTNPYCGHSLNNRIAVTDISGLSAVSGGMKYVKKYQDLSVLDLNEGDKISMEFISEGAPQICSNNVSYIDGSTVQNITSATAIVSGTVYTLLSDGSFDLYFNTSNAATFSKLTIKKPQTMTIGATGYRTFSAPEAIDISGQTNFGAYYASSEADGVVTMTKITDGIIPANTAVMLYGTSGTFYYTTATGSTNFSSNLLQPVVSDAQEVGITYTGKTTYVLAKPASTVCFAKLSAACTDMGGKAYLLLPNGGGARQISFNFDNEATDISTVNGEGSKVNGCESAYSLSGQRVGKDYKGLVIKNGKKYIIK